MRKWKRVRRTIEVVTDVVYNKCGKTCMIEGEPGFKIQPEERGYDEGTE